MQRRDLPLLVIGILITAGAACRATPPDSPITLEPAWSSTPAGAPDSPSPNAEPPTPAAPDETLPTPLPMPGPAAGRQALGSDRAGLSLDIPVTWVNLTDQLDIPTMDNRLGINLVFAADSERTGHSLLAGKAFAGGAYVAGLIVAPPAGTTDAATALVDLLPAAAPRAVPLTASAPLVSANGVGGYYLDVAGGPVGLNAAAPNDLRTRVVLYTPPAADDAPVWIVLLLSASASRWDQHIELFDDMLRSARVFGVRPGAPAQAGNVVVRGQLAGDRATVSATLDRAVSDLWTFTLADSRFAGLLLTPDEAHLDLTLTLLDPNRRALAHIDNGYAGVAESATDILLLPPGVYIVEVTEFQGQPGRYTLSLTLDGQAQHDVGGAIAFGQALQSRLAANGQQKWVFQGTGGQHVTIVVEPAEPTFDALLDLFGPDGQPLVALDEGFSGDPELLSGFVLPATGEYAILVRAFAPQGGSYTISLAEGEQPIANYHDAGDLLYGSVQQATLQRREAHAWFFQGRAGDHILIRVSPLSGGLDPDVWLLDEAVERVAAADAYSAGEPETIELTLAGDGGYIVLVRDFNGEAGDYEIVLGAAPIATPQHAGWLSYGDAIIGSIAPNTAVSWSFIAQAGDVIDVTALATEAGGDLVLQLRGPDGLTVLEVDAGSAGGGETLAGYIVPTPGAWQLVLSEFFGQAAGYRLSLDRAQ